MACRGDNQNGLWIEVNGIERERMWGEVDRMWGEVDGRGRIAQYTVQLSLNVPVITKCRIKSPSRFQRGPPSKQ